MEARPSTAAACLCCLLALAGCTLQNSKPEARPQDTDGASPQEQSEVVQGSTTDDVQTAADVEPGVQQVQRWVEQIQRRDDLGSRVTSVPADSTFSSVPESNYQPDTSELGVTPDSTPAPDSTDPPADEPPAPAAPVLGSVAVRAAAEAIDASLLQSGTSASVNAPENAVDEPITLPRFVEQWLARPTDPTFRDQLDRRLLQVLAGKYEDARQPLELVSNEQQQMARQLIEAVVAIREGHGGDPGAEANRVLAQIKKLEESLVPLTDLRIPKLALTRVVRGYGRYEAFEPPHFLTGRENEFVVYCEVESFLSRLKDDGRYESQFSMRTAILNRAGDVVLDINDAHIADECRTRRHDCFIPRLVRLPATLSPGEYVVKVTIIDKIGKKVAEKRTTFRILARS